MANLLWSFATLAHDPGEGLLVAMALQMVAQVQHFRPQVRGCPASCGGVGLHLLHVPRDLLAAQTSVEGGAGAADSAQGRLGVLPSSFRSISEGANLAQVMGRSCTASQSDRESAGQGSADDEHVGPYVESVYRL